MKSGKNILSAVDVKAAKRWTEELYALEKGGSYANFPAVAEYCRKSLAEAGFENIEIIEHCADGKSGSFDCTMPPAWDICGRSFLQIAGENIILADTEVIPWCAAPWSGATPPEGVQGELIALAPGDEIADVKNKWVLLTIPDGSNPQGAYLQQLCRMGAAGVAVMDMQSGRDYPAAVRWFNGTGRSGWYPVAGEERLPLFALSGKNGKMLLEKLAKGRVFLHGVMNTKIYSGRIYTITAVIPGHSATEYALFSHIYEPFAADNSFGFGGICAIGRAIREELGTPEKTLRVVFSMELYGFAAFLADPQRASRIAGALNMDAINHRKQKLLKYFDSPLCNPFFADWVIPEKLTGSLEDTAFIRSGGILCDDTFPGDPLCGNIPVNWCMNPSGTAHHCGCEDFEVDWQWAEKELPAFADAVADILQYSLEQVVKLPEIAEAEFLAESRVICEQNISGREKYLLLETLFDYLLGRLKSAEKYCKIAVDKSCLEKLFRQTVEKIAIKNDFSEMEKKASQITVLRLKATPFSFADIPFAERKSFRCARLLYALFDGNRNLWEAIRINDWICGKRSDAGAIQQEIENLEYFAKYNYVVLKKNTVNLTEGINSNE